MECWEFVCDSRPTEYNTNDGLERGTHSLLKIWHERLANYAHINYYHDFPYITDTTTQTQTDTHKHTSSDDVR